MCDFTTMNVDSHRCGKRQCDKYATIVTKILPIIPFGATK
jgi:hypothetical protein